MHDILVVGIATVDAVARPVDAIPEPGGLRFFDDLTITTGGCAINCAIALARLGVACDVVARVGRDMLGDFVVGELARHAIATAHIARDQARSTSYSFVAVGSNGQQRFFHTTGANATIGRDDVGPELLAGRKLVFVTGAMLMDSLDGEPTARLLADARATGATTLLDTVFIESLPRDAWRRRIMPALPMLDYFIPSLAEARALTGLDEPGEIARRLRADGARNVVIKLGPQGALCVDQHGGEQMAPAFRVDCVIDTTGAGDCWSAGFLVGLRKGLPIEQAARLGNAVAAHGIQAAGATAGVPTLAAVERFISTR